MSFVENKGQISDGSGLQIPGSGGIANHGGTFSGGADRDDSWYSFGNWFLYTFNEKLTGVWRSEIFRDNNGVRTGTAANYAEFTLGDATRPTTPSIAGR